jgi:hypothetical protein
MSYKPDIIHYFYEFAPCKSFLNENEQFSNLGILSWLTTNVILFGRFKFQLLLTN